MIDLSAIGANWFTLATFVVNLVVGWIVWSLSSRFASKDDHAKLVSRIQSVEERLEQIPGAKAVHELSIQMTALHGELKSTNTRLDGFNDLSRRMQKQLDLIDGFLRHHGAGP